MSDWTDMPLAKAAIDFNAKRVPVKQSERVAGPFPYYGASGVVDHVDDYLFEGEYLLVAEDGANLLTRNTPVAFMASGRFWVNNHAHILRGSDFARTRYLKYLIEAMDIAPYVTGSAQPKLSKQNLMAIPVTLPSISTQDQVL
ncbi:MAG: restriction endonuclease subunit S, partial [Phycisphaerales bacterium]|nr:restriction endonuclease subunit S [Phycisphaerales bacterium]